MAFTANRSIPATRTFCKTGSERKIVTSLTSMSDVVNMQLLFNTYMASIDINRLRRIVHKLSNCLQLHNQMTQHMATLLAGAKPENLSGNAPLAFASDLMKHVSFRPNLFELYLFPASQ